jgi:ABC-type sugar transport system permease subunit
MTLGLNRMKRHLVPLILLAPALITIVVVIGFPIGRAIWLTFQDYNVLRPERTTFAGLDNYLRCSATPPSGPRCGTRSCGWAAPCRCRSCSASSGALLLNQRFAGATSSAACC